MLNDKLKIALFIVAILVALSRPIVGVHYFSDIFIGAIIGSLLGYLISIGALETDKYIGKKKIIYFQKLKISCRYPEKILGIFFLF